MDNAVPQNENEQNSDNSRNGLPSETNPSQNINAQNQQSSTNNAGENNPPPRQNDAEWQRKHSIVDLWINGILAFVTIVAVAISVWSNTMTRESLAISDSTFKLMKAASDGSDKKDKEMLEYARQTLVANNNLSIANMEMVNEMKSQFVIGNEPYLQVDVSAIKNVGLRISTVDCILRNLGKTPVSTIEIVQTIGITEGSSPIPPISKFNIKIDSFPNTTFISNEKPAEFPRAFIDTQNYNKYVRPKTYIGGHVSYINLVTKQRKKYSYIIYIQPEKSQSSRVYTKTEDIQ